MQGRDPGRSVSASDAESRADRLSDSGGCDDPSPGHDSTNFKLYRGQAGQLLPNQRPGKPAARPARRGAGRAARLCGRRVNHLNTSSPGRKILLLYLSVFKIEGRGWKLRVRTSRCIGPAPASATGGNATETKKAKVVGLEHPCSRNEEPALTTLPHQSGNAGCASLAGPGPGPLSQRK